TDVTLACQPATSETRTYYPSGSLTAAERPPYRSRARFRLRPVLEVGTACVRRSRTAPGREMTAALKAAVRRGDNSPDARPRFLRKVDSTRSGNRVGESG